MGRRPKEDMPRSMSRFERDQIHLNRMASENAYLRTALEMIAEAKGLLPIELAGDGVFFKELARRFGWRLDIARRALQGDALEEKPSGLLALLTPDRRTKALAYEGDDTVGEQLRAAEEPKGE